MPVYEYKAITDGCAYCKSRFEVLQKINEEPITKCPRCGATVRRLVSRSMINVVENLSESERLVKHTPEEADKLGLEDGFAEDRIYES